MNGKEQVYTQLPLSREQIIIWGSNAPHDDGSWVQYGVCYSLDEAWKATREAQKKYRHVVVDLRAGQSSDPEMGSCIGDVSQHESADGVCRYV